MALLSVPFWVYVLVLVVVAGVGFFVGPLAGVAVLLATALALFLWVKVVERVDRLFNPTD